MWVRRRSKNSNYIKSSALLPQEAIYKQRSAIFYLITAFLFLMGVVVEL